MSQPSENEKPVKKKREPNPKFVGIPQPRELWKIVNWYSENVRPHNEAQLLGVIRQIQNMLARKEVSAADLALAVRNYAKHDKTRSTPKEYRYTFKKFCRESMVQQWLNPQEADPVLRRLAEIAKAAESTKPAPVVEDEVPAKEEPAMVYTDDDDDHVNVADDDLLLADLTDD